MAVHYNLEGARESASSSTMRVGWSPLDTSPSTPVLLRLVRGPQFHKRAHRNDTVFHGAIADTEPDEGTGEAGHTARPCEEASGRASAKEARSRRPLNQLDFLLAVDDESRVGALRFRDESGEFQRAHEDGRRHTPPNVSLAQLAASSRAVEMDEETMADLDYLRGRGTSLGGLRPKCSIVTPDGHLAIGKFPSVGDQRAVTKGEVLALQVAKDAGVRAAEASLVDSGGLPVAVVRRFDRDGGLRIPYVSAATLLGVSPRDPEVHTYTDIVECAAHLRRQSDQRTRGAMATVAFSILITNLDDHLLNHGFLHQGNGRWSLSPAFDVRIRFPIDVESSKHGSPRDPGPDASLEPLMDAAQYFQIKLARAGDCRRGKPCRIELAGARTRDRHVRR